MAGRTAPSIFDPTPVVSGHTVADAIAATIDLARRGDDRRLNPSPSTPPA